jgi:C4-dicarboxylate transporter DctM subunit
VYGIMVEQSIGKLFIAGILPGIVLAALFIACILIMCLLKPSLGPSMPATTWKQKFRSLSGTVEMLVLFFLVMGGLMIGWFTPTEAAGIGAAGALVIALVGRNLSWANFKKALQGTTRTASMVLLIIACAMIFSRFLTVSGLPQGLAHWVSELNAPAWVILGIVMVIYIIGGCVMDSLSLLIITINIFYPIITGLGYDPIWFGVIIVVLMETGAVTPPVGINVYVIKGIAPEVELYTIFKGIVPFLSMMFVCLIILTIWPQIALVLPRMMK